MSPRFPSTFLMLLTTVAATEPSYNSCLDMASNNFRCSGPDIDLVDCNLTSDDAEGISGCLKVPDTLHDVEIVDNSPPLELPAAVFDELTIEGDLTIRGNVLKFNSGSFQSTKVKGNMVIEDNNVMLDSAAFDGLRVKGNLKIKDNVLDLGSGLTPFSGLEVDNNMYIEGNSGLTALASPMFAGLSVTDLIISENDKLASIGAQSFDGLSATNVEISDNPDLTSFEPLTFDGLEVDKLKIFHNLALVAIRKGVFDGLKVASSLVIKDNVNLETLEAGLFDGLLPKDDHNSVKLKSNTNLECTPAVPSCTTLYVNGALDDASVCGCPAQDLTFDLCDNELTCVGGTDGYTCNVSCDDSTECMMDEICCEEDNLCKPVPAGEDYEAFLVACGDPHMTGFHGQRFDFTGEDGFWYALLADDGLHVNMRVTTPVPGLPEITYITGLSVLTTGDDGLQHSIVIEVKDPHTLSSACPAGMPSCLGDGALTVVVDGEEALLTPGTYSVGPGVTVSAANLPGACRSFGFEKYWERKKVEYAQAGRRLDEKLQDMSEWILGDPTATNLDECMEYLARAALDGNGVFAHQSEHVSFQIVTPISTIRLSHGRLHQVSMRDPTDTYDLPDHLTWQMNVAIDQTDVTPDAKGVLGETIVPTVDALGDYIKHGMESIRGEQEDYLVSGPLEVAFALGKGHQY
ncbi:unnamed protein product [Scytosiphon promiscuus]